MTSLMFKLLERYEARGKSIRRQFGDQSNDIISKPYPIPNKTLELNYGNQFEDMFVSYSITFITNR